MTKRHKGRHRTKGAAASHELTSSLSSVERNNNSSRSFLHWVPTGHLSGKSIAACAVYTVASLAIVFLNRLILTRRFPFPITLAWIQEIVGATVYIVLSSVGEAAREAPLAEARPGSDSGQIQQKLDASTAKSQSRHCVSRPQCDIQSNSCRRRSRLLFTHARRWAAHSLSLLFPVVPLHSQALRGLLPVSIAFVGMVGFGNACLQRVQVSTYQVARSLTLVITLGLQKFLLGLHVSLGAAISCCVVCFGFFIGSLETTTLSSSGALTGFLSSVSQATYNALVRQAVDHRAGAEAAAMYYNMVNASLLLPPLIWASGEAESLYAYLFRQLLLQQSKDKIDVGVRTNHQFVQGTTIDVLHKDAMIGDRSFLEVAALLLASGTLAFILTISTSWIISLTSPVTFSVLGYTKACAQTILGFWILREVCTTQAFAGVVLTISGSVMFLICKGRDAKIESKRR